MTNKHDTPNGTSRGRDGVVRCDDCHRECCQVCFNCDCDGYPCVHQDPTANAERTPPAAPPKPVITVKVGRKEGFVSSYNLFFESGLRLMTADLTWLAVDERDKIRLQFKDVLTTLETTYTIEGSID